MKKIMACALVLVLCAGLFSACGTAVQSLPEDGKLKIVASIFPEYDFARAIAGDLAHVALLIAPGASIHSFDPSPSEMQTVQQADIFLYVGGESDVWADRLLASLDTSHMKILRLMDAVKPEEEEHKEGMQAEEEAAGGAPVYDEHIWTSPRNALLLVDAILQAMVEKDPKNTETYVANATKYRNELRAIDTEFMEVVAGAQRRTIVVADNFPFLYFIRAYGLDYAAAFPGCSDETDASAATIAHLINVVKEQQIPYVYHAELSNAGVAKAIAGQTGAGVLQLNSCHNVSRKEFSNGATYLSLMRENVEALRKGLY